MKSARFSAQMMQTLAYLSKNMLAQPQATLPKYTSMGEEIKTIEELANVMGVNDKIAAAFVIQNETNAELKSDAIEVLKPGIYNAFEDGYEPIVHYAYDVANKTIIEEKRVRMVRGTSGANYFKQPVGSIIVSDGAKPLDALLAATNDVPGYQKVMDKNGNAYYIGKEQGYWVVRSGANKMILYHDAGSDGERQSLYWLNTQLGGRAKQGKSMPEDVETKRQFTSMAVEKLGKQGHAFRNKNGSYSYPISTVADLKNAIQAFGRSAPEDRERLKAFIKKRARQLGREELIPDNWKTGEPMDLEIKKPVSAMDTTPLDRSTNKNWVEISGQLPPYIRAIAHALIRDHGFTVSRAIATAISRIKKWLADPNTTAETKAKCAKALTQWEALRAKNKARMAAKKG